MTPVRKSREAHLVNGAACEPSVGTITDALHRAARDDDEQLLISLLDERDGARQMTFGDVHDASVAWVRAFLTRGLEHQGRVAILLPTGADFLGAFFGTLMAGGIPVPCSVPLGLGDKSAAILNLQKIIASAAPQLLVTDEGLVESAQKLMITIGRGQSVLLPDEPQKTTTSIPFPRLDSEELGLLQHASGPTSWMRRSVIL